MLLRLKYYVEELGEEFPFEIRVKARMGTSQGRS